MGKFRRRLVLIAVFALAFAWAAGVGAAFLNEGKTPPDSAFPAVPGHALVNGTSKKCGSGGCWTEMAVEAGSSELAKGLIKDMNLAQERCSSRNLLTLNRICTGSSLVGDGVRVYLRYAY